MKAAYRSAYGSPEVLSIKEIDIPVPKENEILIRVHAATVSRTDCGVLGGKPYIVRIFTGLSKPQPEISGSDFAGEIESIGKQVKNFKVGDRVMGFSGIIGCGSHAQFIVFPETKGILTIPDNLGYAEAAACMEGAFYAHNIVNVVKPKPGQKALVNCATGAIGSSMVQFLKFYGLYVTAVCDGQHKELVSSLGADKIIDYKNEDFTKDPEQYDFVFDAVGKSSFARCRSLLTDKGIYSSSDGFKNLFLSWFTSLGSGKKVVFAMPRHLKAGLGFIKELAEKGKFRPVIDRTYPLEKIADAYRYVALGQKTGNVILTMDA